MARRICMVVHGGVGNEIPVADHGRLGEGCAAAVKAGYDILAAGGRAADAVVAAAKSLEDNPLFNSGTGSALTRAGTVEMDAAWMNGQTLQAGAVACVTRLKNPIVLARAVAEKTPHVLLVGAGAEAFAEELGMSRVSAESLITPSARARWQAQSAGGANPRLGPLGQWLWIQRATWPQQHLPGVCLSNAPGASGTAP